MKGLVLLTILCSILIQAKEDVGARWYYLNPQRAFTAGFNSNDYNNGACNGHWKDAAFMQAPYIKTTSSSVKATVTGAAVQNKACIYQHTQTTCTFALGNELQGLEFDYTISGDTWSNWFSFWVNSYNGGWVPEAEVDVLEGMQKGSRWQLAHNFAGYGKEVEFQQAYYNNGHVSASFANTGARSTDCASGRQCNVQSPNAAYQNWSGTSVNQINSGQLRHHLVIDYWITWLAGSLEVRDIWLYGNLGSCSVAQPAERLPQLTFANKMFANVGKVSSRLLEKEGQLDTTFEKKDTTTNRMGK